MKHFQTLGQILYLHTMYNYIGKGTMFSVLTVTTLPSFPWQKCTVRQQLYQKPGGHQYSACLYYSAILSQSTQLKSNPDIHCHSVTLSQSTFSEKSWCGLSLCHIVTEYTALKNLGVDCHTVTLSQSTHLRKILVLIVTV